MKRNRQTPIWPYLLLLACLFGLSVAAPRAWRGGRVGDGPQASRIGTAVVVKRPTHTVPSVEIDPYIEPALVEPTPDQDALDREALELEPTSERAVAELPPSLARQAPLETAVEAPPMIAPVAITAPAQAFEEAPPAPVTADIPMPIRTPHAVPMESIDAKHSSSLWQPPTSLIDQIKAVGSYPECTVWSNRVLGLLSELATRSGAEDPSTAGLLIELATAADDALRLANNLPDSASVGKLLRAEYALRRRIELWHKTPGLGSSLHVTRKTNSPIDHRQLTRVLGSIETLLSQHLRGRSWREFLLISQLTDSSAGEHPDDFQLRALSHRLLERLTRSPMTPEQRRFTKKPPISTLANLLRRELGDCVDGGCLLSDVEEYEQSLLTSHAKRLASDYRSLAWSDDEVARRQAAQIENHYRNANVRVAVSSKLLNRLIPQPNAMSAPINDMIMGAEVFGQSTTFTTLSLRLIPDARRLRIGLEATGTVASNTAAMSGPATLHTQGQSSFIIRKLVVIDDKGLRTKPAMAEANNYMTNLVGVESDYDVLPIVGSLVRNYARSQHAELQAQARAEVENKLANKARDLAQQNADKVDTVIDKAGDLVDKKTDGKFAEKVDSAQEAAKKAIRKDN